MTRDEFNQFCQSFPVTSHVVQWHNSDVWKVGGKIFASCNSQEDPIPGITFKTSRLDYEILPEQPGFRPAPYLASRGMSWIQRYDRSELTDDDLRHYITKSYQTVTSGFSNRKRSELGL